MTFNLRRAVRRLLPPSATRVLPGVGRSGSAPRVGRVRFGQLRRLTPISRVFGYDRGMPVDRYYIESFLARHAADVRGHVLEIGDDSYTRRFGGDRVTKSDILHVSRENPRATIVTDLAADESIPPETFDCVIITQTLQLIYDTRAAVRTLHRVLKPGGLCLATAPGISQIDAGEWGHSWYWAFTTASTHRLFAEPFDPANVQVTAHGNVLAATAFLYGLGAEELSRAELDYHDPCYQMLLTCRARKAPRA